MQRKDDVSASRAGTHKLRERLLWLALALASAVWLGALICGVVVVLGDRQSS